MRKHEIRPGIRHLLRLPVRRDGVDADDEIRLHLHLRTEQLVREGLSPEAARAEAERRFGPVEDERTRFREAARRRDRRQRAGEWIASVGQDVRYALRTLRRDAGFTLFAVLIAGLGIGASATVFSVVNAVLLRPMPFRNADRLVWISNVADDGVSEWQIQVDHFLDMARRNRSLEGIAAYFAYYDVGDAALDVNGTTQRLTRVPVTCNFFPFLGVKPLIGRSYTADECRYGASPTVMLTEAVWRRLFKSNPAIVGRTITINDAPTTVIGVLPASFDFPSVFAPGSTVEVFSPYPLSEETNRNGNTLAVVGRLRPDVSVERARRELITLGKELSAEFPNRNMLRPRVLPLDEHVNGRVRPALLVLALAIVAVMIIVCANLSSLQFARMSTRQRELAVRLALGAARGRLVRQMLTESLVLASGGALLGLMLAVVGTRFVSRLHAFDIPLLARVRADGDVLAVTIIVAVLTGVLVGVLPALHAPNDVQDTLKDSARGTTRGGRQTRMRTVLVVTEIAAAYVLLVAAGLLVRSFVHVLDVDLGFSPSGAAALRVDPARPFADHQRANIYYDDVLGRVRAMPTVTSAALADVLPFGGDRSWGVGGQGQVYPRDAYPQAFIRVVSDGYFQTMRIPVREGREFTAGDALDAPPVVIVNEMLARMLWPGRHAVGQNIDSHGRLLRVVGVVGDVRHDALEGSFTGELYFPLRQQSDHGAVDLVVRSPLAPEQLASSVRQAIHTIAPDAMTNRWLPLQELIDKAASPRRFVVTLLGAFSLFALLLAALGIYALISYGVTQRTQEIGVRLALGASALDVRSLIMRGTLVMAVSGAAIGVAGAALLAPSLNAMLFGVTWSDSVSFTGALTILLLVAASAGYFPARRASRVDPSVALRDA